MLFGCGYVYGWCMKSGKLQKWTLHRFVLDLDSDLAIDHKNGDRLDNRRQNLRVATHQENAFNSTKLRGTWTSKFKGVSWDATNQKWRASIRVNERAKNLGRFSLEIEAALKYDETAMRHFGEFARTNKMLGLL